MTSVSFGHQVLAEDFLEIHQMLVSLCGTTDRNQVAGIFKIKLSTAILLLILASDMTDLILIVPTPIQQRSQGISTPMLQEYHRLSPQVASIFYLKKKKKPLPGDISSEMKMETCLDLWMRQEHRLKISGALDLVLVIPLPIGQRFTSLMANSISFLIW